MVGKKIIEEKMEVKKRIMSMEEKKEVKKGIQRMNLPRKFIGKFIVQENTI